MSSLVARFRTLASFCSGVAERTQGALAAQRHLSKMFRDGGMGQPNSQGGFSLKIWDALGRAQDRRKPGLQSAGTPHALVCMTFKTCSLYSMLFNLSAGDRTMITVVIRLQLPGPSMYSGNLFA